MIIGLYSPSPQSGKSTVASILQLHGWKRRSFATPVKKSLLVVLEAIGVREAEAYLYGNRKDQVIPELGVTGGYLMSHYATTFFRNMVNKDVWVQAAMRSVPNGGHYVFDDLRFPNEFAWIKRLSGLTVCITRPGNTIKGRSANSEGQLAGFDFDLYLSNCGTEEEFKITVQAFAASVPNPVKENN